MRLNYTALNRTYISRFDQKTVSAGSLCRIQLQRNSQLTFELDADHININICHVLIIAVKFSLPFMSYVVRSVFY